MAETTTTQSTPPAQPAAPSPAPAAAPAQPAAPPAPPPTGDQAIADGKGRPAGKPMSARDFSRSMGGGSSPTEALITEAAKSAVPQSPAPTQESGEPVTPPAEGTATAEAPPGEQRTKPNRAGEPQPIDEKGKYQSPEQKAQAEQAAAGDEPVAEGDAPTEPEATPEGSSTEPAETEAAADAVPEGMVRIEIPEELQRNFGKFRDVPKEDEEFVRFNLNNRVRNNEVERLQREAKEAAELRTRVEELESRDLRTQVTTEAQQKFKETPEYKAFAEQYQAFRQAEEEGSLPEGSASRYWQDAVLPAFKTFEGDLLTSKNQEIANQQADRDGQQWGEEMWTRVSALPKVLTELPGFRNEFDAAIDAFGYEIERGRFDALANDPDRREKLSTAFNKYFNARLIGLYPAAAEAIQRASSKRAETQRTEEESRQKAEQARIEREAAEKSRREAEEAARNTATNPLGSVPSDQVFRHAEGATPKLNARQFDRVMTRRG